MALSDELRWLDATAQAELVRRREVKPSELVDAALQRIGRRIVDWFETYDAWLTPTMGAAPAPLGELVGTDAEPLRGAVNTGRYLMFDAELANITGNPAMSVPFGFDADGMPVAIHILGRFGGEATLFRLAAQLEEAMPWAKPHPSVTDR